MVDYGINCAVESDPSSVWVVMSNGMYQKFICCLALCLAIASQLSHAANNGKLNNIFYFDNYIHIAILQKRGT